MGGGTARLGLNRYRLAASLLRTGLESRKRMIEAARPKLAADAERLHLLLAECRKKLAPLQDPFDTDLGLHRWLHAEREEAYSDWLEWVVREAASAERIFKLFGLPKPPQTVAGCCIHAQRECCVPHGHVDQGGRLDLVIRCGDQVIIVVEVKTGSAEDADTAKHHGYQRWLEGQDYLLKSGVFLAVSAEEKTYDGFSFLSWEDVCIEMRTLAIDFYKAGRLMPAAMVLAFVAAVEQNLLGFSAASVRALRGEPVGFFNPRIVNHLELFLKRLEAVSVIRRKSRLVDPQCSWP